MYVVHIYGGIAQLARVLGSYPIGRRFESHCRYQIQHTYLRKVLHKRAFRAPHIRPGGQAVKTPPFHGGNTSSILVRVTTKHLQRCRCFFLFTICLIKIENRTHDRPSFGGSPYGGAERDIK